MGRIDDRWVRWLLVPAIVFISQATNDAYLVDYWHHLARGREMVRTGQLLDYDIFTFTVPGRAFLDVNWLTQIAYFYLDSWGGLGLVRTVNALILAGAWAWLVGICKRESGSLEIAMAVGLATFLGAWQVLTIRPQTVSIVLFIGLYDVLLRAEKDWRWLAVTPVFLALWANVHGAFPAGLMLVGMFVGEQIFRLLPSRSLSSGTPGERVGVRGGSVPCDSVVPPPDSAPSPPTPLPRSTGGEGRRVALLVLAAAACAAATLVNPYGWEVYQYAAHTSGVSARRGIDEWLPPSWDQGIGVAWFLSLPIVIGTIGWNWKKGRRVSWREAFLLMCFGFLAVRSIRMVVWWLIIIAPMIAVRLADFWPRSRAIIYVPSRAAAFTVVGLLTICVLSLPPLHGINPLLKVRSPDETMANLDEALAFLETKQKKGNLFAKLEWGEYLGWRGSPNWRVYIDGRIEVYPDDIWELYASFTRNQEPGASELPLSGSVSYFILDDRFHRRTGLLPYKNESNWMMNEIWRKGDVVVYAFRTINLRPVRERPSE